MQSSEVFFVGDVQVRCMVLKYCTVLCTLTLILEIHNSNIEYAAAFFPR